MKRVERWVLACAKACCKHNLIGDGCKLAARTGTSTYDVMGAAIFETEEEARHHALHVRVGSWAPREVFFRLRRGVLVLIPPTWVGKVTHPQTIRKRPSKQTHKSRLRDKHLDGNRRHLVHTHKNRLQEAPETEHNDHEDEFEAAS